MMKNVNLHFDYSRACLVLSCRVLLYVALSGVVIGPALVRAQSPAQLAAQASKNPKDAPTLRAVAVLEWTGDDPAKPKTSRLVPVSIYDGSQIEDAGLYLSRPEPLALAGEVEYQLKQNGKTTGLFVIKNAAQEQGSWVGYGEWKPAPAAKPAFAAVAPSADEDNEDDDKPTLHRKHHDGDSTGSSGASSNTGSTTKSSDDNDRPTLHKKSDSGSSSGTTAPSTGSNSGSGSSGGSDDTDRPTLHKKSPDNSSATTAPSDSDRPVMKRSKSKPAEDIGHSEALPNVTDPDRPRLQRGKDNSQSLKVLPSLMGLPPNMRQTVGVSDAKDHPDHPWSYTWANPGDEAKMKAALEGLARTALGLATPPASQPLAPARRTSPRASTHKAAKPASASSATNTIPLVSEQFRVFELTYGSGATLVFSAQASVQDQQKYVTLIAQPDLYGNLTVLHQSVTDSAHLDETPRMILVDAVDALADNRGELLFELRGQTQRQFALYRVLRGSAEKIFETDAAAFGSLVAQ